MSKIKIFDILKDIGADIIGSAIFAIGVDVFTGPNNIAPGGVTAIATMLNSMTNIQIGTLNFLLNMPLVILGLVVLGKKFTLSTLRSVVILSLVTNAFDVLLPEYTGSVLLAAIFGGVCIGVGMGIIFLRGSTTGGTDIVARLLKLKFPWLPMGKLVLVPDGVVLTLAALAFGGVEAALYGAVAIFVSGRVMDTVLYGLDTSKVAYIISDRWQQVADALLREQQRGVTILRGQGAWTGDDKQVLLVAFKQKEIMQIKQAVHELDPRAFMIVCDAHDVLGEGFGDYQKEDI